tara:strand:- start:366 stop:4184 length:3819 start_codon:yes stop_codon:yes gene_type:complete
MTYVTQTIPETPSREAMTQAYRIDETESVEHLLQHATLPDDMLKRTYDRAYSLVDGVRSERLGASGMDAFMQQYDLSTNEGIALMCVAEAMLRIPDSETVDKLIRDKLAPRDWKSHMGGSDSRFVNAATWGLMLTGKVITDHEQQQKSLRSAFKKLVKGASEPVIRQAVGHAMRIIGKQFVMGRDIKEALKNAKASEAKGYRYSYDMLGEAARTMADADRYYESYKAAIIAIGESTKDKNAFGSAGISVKLSALHPRYQFLQRERVLEELTPRVLELVQLAKGYDIGFTIDAEEADRLDISLDIIETIFCDKSLGDWSGFGLAVQAYQKRAWYVLDYLIELAKSQGKRFMVRLVKGAYWDSEIKISQEEGFEGYPVFTRKANTDVSYIACACKMLAATDTLYPQFATHNAYSLAAILEMLPASGRDKTDFEFQCLHGMGQTLYNQIVGSEHLNIPCRIYAPVGNHKDLLPYLVRRLLENGANSSFVNRIVDADLPIEDIIKDPVAYVAALADKQHPRIPVPAHIYGTSRTNSSGFDFSNRDDLNRLAEQMQQLAEKSQWTAAPTLASSGEEKDVTSPTDGSVVGRVKTANADDMQQALETAHAAFTDWNIKPACERADVLRCMADLLETNTVELMTILSREAGKTLHDAISEVREAVDFCRYYAGEAEALSADTQGRGVIVCISPWNFPLAIFLGQVSSALVAGNCVLAKPADQTPLIAAFAFKLFHEAGAPKEVLQLIPGRGSVVGAQLIADERVKGVLFTGSTETAQVINRNIAERGGYNVTFVAETGGQNAMIVDSSALPEQIIDDVILSAFGSAGQRCSALRVLFVQEDIADGVIHMLKGAMQEVCVGDPRWLSTDVGPVIDQPSLKVLEDHAKRMDKEAKLIYQVSMDKTDNGTFFAPRAYELTSLSQLKREVFGPVLHVLRYRGQDLDKVLQEINDSGYGLTMGIHSRIEETVRHIQKHTRVGNTYINRNMIGAVVGVQPFGGEGLSGTGPKAGGPHYLPNLCQSKGPQFPHTPNQVKLGHEETSNSAFNHALDMASQTANVWQFVPVAERIKMIKAVADRMTAKKAQFLEVLPENSAEEEMYLAVDNCRDIALHAEKLLLEPLVMPGPTGESNVLSLHPRGVVACLSSLDSPLVSGVTQICAALIAGNTVIIKPSCNRIAISKVLHEVLQQAGIPKDVVHILSGSGKTIGRKIMKDPRVDVVMFNGPAEIASSICKELAERDGKLVPLILTDDYHHYLERLSTERTVTENTTAKGGNAALLSLEE